MKPDYTRLEFGAAPLDRPYVILNMVSSIDGKAVVEGSEKGLGSKTDQRLMRELRTNADTILNGAGTLRASGTSLGWAATRRWKPFARPRAGRASPRQR